MKSTAALGTLLTLTAVGAALAYQTAARERDYREQIRRGDLALRSEETVAAIEAYSGAIVLRPDAALPYLRRGETYEARGELDAAVRDFRSAAGLDPSAVRPLEELADALYARRRYGASAESYERRLRLDERSPDVLYKLALARYRDGDIDAALAALDQSARLADQTAPVYYLRGLCLREKRRRQAAAAAFEHAVALSPGMVPAHEELAGLYDEMGRQPDALEQLQILAGLDREHVERDVAVGLAHARAGRTDMAVATLGSALERAPDDPLTYSALGRVWLETTPSTDTLNKALQALEHAASTPSASSEALTLYGRALLAANQPEAAESVLQEALQRYPIDPAAYLEYAEAAERQAHAEAARNALQLHEALAPDDGESANRALRIGTLSLQLNDLDTAAAWLRRASAATPADPLRLAPIADAQLQAGDRSGALDTISKGLAREPDNTALLEMADRARSQVP